MGLELAHSVQNEYASKMNMRINGELSMQGVGAVCIYRSTDYLSFTGVNELQS